MVFTSNMHADRGLQLLSADVARRLEAFVFEGGYKPGDKLPSERELALQFGVSRTAIREGIKLLSQNGLLQSSVGRGLFVGQLSTLPVLSSLNVLLQLGGGTLHDVVQVRNVLESLAARLAAENATDEELDELGLLVDEMVEIQAAGGSYGVPGTPGPKFHILMARASHNPLLGALIEPALALMNRGDTNPTQRSRGTARGVENHRRILNALRARDADAAVAAVESHCQWLMDLRTQSHPDWKNLSFDSSDHIRR
jgi:GntR family transcriptional repressor for pyruvate dehydrogenase complex